MTVHHEEHVLDDYGTCFRCKAHPPAPGGEACSGCRRFLAGYTDVDPKDTAPAPSGLTDAQADFVLGLASARGLEVTRDELEELWARRADAPFDIGDTRDRVASDGWAVQTEAGEWLTGDAGVAHLEATRPTYV